MAVGRETSIALRGFGWLGLLVCLALAAGVLLGRAWVGGRADELFTTADTAIADGLAGIDEATGRLSDGVASLDGLLGELGPLPSSSPVPAAIAGRISSAIDSYAGARDRYVAIRESARSTLRSLEVAARLVPQAQVPPEVTNALEAVDRRLVGIDSALAAMRGSAQATAGDVATAATSLRDAGGSAVDAARELRTRLDGLHVRVAETRASVDRGLWIGAGLALIVVGYVALLNLLVIWLARRGRRPDEPPPTEDAIVDATEADTGESVAA